MQNELFLYYKGQIEHQKLKNKAAVCGQNYLIEEFKEMKK